MNLISIYNSEKTQDYLLLSDNIDYDSFETRKFIKEPIPPKINSEARYYIDYEVDFTDPADDMPAFEKIEENLDSHKRIINLLNSNSYESSVGFNNSVKLRIYELIQDLENEEDPEQKPISFESFTSFIQFLTKNNKVSVPSFIITYEGNIRALWRKSKMQHLAAEFAPDGSVFYVIFSPNKKNPEKILRSSGVINQTLLYKVAVSMGADKWIYKNEL